MVLQYYQEDKKARPTDSDGYYLPNGKCPQQAQFVYIYFETNFQPIKIIAAPQRKRENPPMECMYRSSLSVLKIESI